MMAMFWTKPYSLSVLVLVWLLLVVWSAKPVVVSFLGFPSSYLVTPVLNVLAHSGS